MCLYHVWFVYSATSGDWACLLAPVNYAAIDVGQSSFHWWPVVLRKLVCSVLYTGQGRRLWRALTDRRGCALAERGNVSVWGLLTGHLPCKIHFWSTLGTLSWCNLTHFSVNELIFLPSDKKLPVFLCPMLVTELGYMVWLRLYYATVMQYHRLLPCRYYTCIWFAILEVRNSKMKRLHILRAFWPHHTWQMTPHTKKVQEREQERPGTLLRRNPLLCNEITSFMRYLSYFSWYRDTVPDTYSAKEKRFILVYNF